MSIYKCDKYAETKEKKMVITEYIHKQNLKLHTINHCTKQYYQFKVLKYYLLHTFKKHN